MNGRQPLSSELGFSGSLSVSVSISVSDSFYGGRNVPSFDSHNGISSTNCIPSGFRSLFFPGHQNVTGLTSAVGVDRRVVGRGSPQRSDQGVSCLQGIVLPKSWVLEPVFRSLQTPATGSMGLISAGLLLGMPEFREAIGACAWVRNWSDVAVSTTHRANPQSMSDFVPGRSKSEGRSSIFSCGLFRAVGVKGIPDRPDLGWKVFLKELIRFGRVADNAIDASVVISVFDTGASYIASTCRRGSVGAEEEFSGRRLRCFIGWIPILAKPHR